ncbi:MAG: tetratricopeptide repeat protein [Nitrospirales bacterium]
MRYATLVLAVVVVLVAAPACTDFEAGKEAYDRGDYATELQKWRPLAEQGDAEAQKYLGNMYRRGDGVPQDYQEAVRWYRLAAEQGHAGAQAQLGLMYTKGQRVPQDYVQAHMWLSLAAAQGDKRAPKRRDRLAKKMTPAQLAEAQRLAREWKAKSK